MCFRANNHGIVLVFVRRNNNGSAAHFANVYLHLVYFVTSWHHGVLVEDHSLTRYRTLGWLAVKLGDELWVCRYFEQTHRQRVRTLCMTTQLRGYFIERGVVSLHILHRRQVARQQHPMPLGCKSVVAVWPLHWGRIRHSASVPSFIEFLCYFGHLGLRTPDLPRKWPDTPDHMKNCTWGVHENVSYKILVFICAQSSTHAQSIVARTSRCGVV